MIQQPLSLRGIPTQRLPDHLEEFFITKVWIAITARNRQLFISNTFIHNLPGVLLWQMAGGFTQIMGIKASHHWLRTNTSTMAIHPQCRARRYQAETVLWIFRLRMGNSGCVIPHIMQITDLPTDSLYAIMQYAISAGMRSGEEIVGGSAVNRIPMLAHFI